MVTKTLKISAGAMQAARKCIESDVSEDAVRELALEAQPPNDAQWEAIIGPVKGKWHRFAEREKCYVLGGLVFVVRNDVVLTCWRWR